MSFRDKNYRVFLSYAHYDVWIARQLAAILEREGGEAGVGVFMAQQSLLGGDPLAEEIRDALNAADEFVVLVTDAAQASPWVQNEIGGAFCRKIRITPVLHHFVAENMTGVLKHQLAIEISAFDAFAVQVAARAAEKSRGD